MGFRVWGLGFGVLGLASKGFWCLFFPQNTCKISGVPVGFVLLGWGGGGFAFSCDSGGLQKLVS